MDDDIRDHIEAITQALVGKRVVQVWLGYGDVLFAGFGEEMLSLTPDDYHPVPPYELQTNLSVWTVKHEQIILGTSEDEQEIPERAITSILGLCVLQCVIDKQTLELYISLEEQYALVTTPMQDDDLATRDAWWVLFLTGFTE